MFEDCSLILSAFLPETFLESQLFSLCILTDPSKTQRLVPTSILLGQDQGQRNHDHWCVSFQLQIIQTLPKIIHSFPRQRDFLWWGEKLLKMVWPTPLSLASFLFLEIKLLSQLLLMPAISCSSVTSSRKQYQTSYQSGSSSFVEWYFPLEHSALSVIIHSYCDFVIWCLCPPLNL